MCVCLVCCQWVADGYKQTTSLPVCQSENPNRENSNRDTNLVATRQWLDYNKGDLVVTFSDGVGVALDAYSWATADDSPARDPARWRFHGRVA